MLWSVATTTVVIFERPRTLSVLTATHSGDSNEYSGGSTFWMVIVAAFFGDLILVVSV